MNTTTSMLAPAAPSITTFAFRNLPIRVVTLEGEPWFVAADVCRALDMSLVSGTSGYLYYLGQDEKRRIPPGLVGGKGMSQATLISESGLYKLVMRSDKPQAKAFQDWVTKEVLPSIRKTGAYVVGQPSLQENPKMTHMELARAQMSSMAAIFSALEAQDRQLTEQATAIAAQATVLDAQAVVLAKVQEDVEFSKDLLTIDEFFSNYGIQIRRDWKNGFKGTLALYL